MISSPHSSLVILAAITIGLSAASPLQSSDGRARWFKGHMHGHSTNSDGKLPPEQAALWYRDHGYDFCSVTDHRKLTPVEPMSHIQSKDFILLPGIELDAAPHGRNTHTCGLFLRAEVTNQGGDTVTEALQRQVDAIAKAGGMTQINHPNWTWAFNAEEVLPVRGAALLEVYNMSAGCNNEGDPEKGVRSTEAMWDYLLTRGMRIWAVASDDVHTYEVGHPDGPGKGWVVVRASSLTPSNIERAMRDGDFYASSGVELRDVRLSQDQIEVRIEPKPGVTYRTELIGIGGKLLEVAHGPVARFVLDGRTGYVRARVKASDGSLALLQPVFLEARTPASPDLF